MISVRKKLLLLAHTPIYIPNEALFFLQPFFVQVVD